MKKIIFGAMAAAALLACSQDQVIEQNRANDEITFSVVAENQTKAADIYCNNNLPTSFTVSARHKGAIYIQQDKIEWQNGAWVNTSGVRYWPNDEEPIEFTAYVNAVASGTTSINDFEVPVNVNEQVDLLCARTTKYKKDGPVELNFRHALSQVVFQAKNTNPNLYVEIKGVSVCNLGNVNTFNFKSGGATDDNIINHDGNGESEITGEAGYWDPLTGGNTDYAVEFPAVSVVGRNSQVVSLTNTNADGKEYSTNAMLLLPQNTTPWDPADGKPGVDTQEGTYFLVDCKICNVAIMELYAPHRDIVLWDGPVAIPAKFDWEQGKKYIYTFVFGNGNGGYDPDGPDPVLVPIEFDITVDDFVPVANQDIAMETNK